MLWPTRCPSDRPPGGGQSILVFPQPDSGRRCVVEYRRLKTLHGKVICTGKHFKGVPMKTRDEVWSSQRWVKYFRSNAASLMAIPWELGIRLSPQERRGVESSVSEFQLGGSLDGVRVIERTELNAIRG